MLPARSSTKENNLPKSSAREQNQPTGDPAETSAGSPVEPVLAGTDDSPERICNVCRNQVRRHLLIRLTTDHISGTVHINGGKPAYHGRSVYLCRTRKCVDAALKGTRLKNALEGRKGKNLANRRTVKWPLEAQLIQDILAECTYG